MKKFYFVALIFFILVFSFKTLACAQCNQPIELGCPYNNSTRNSKIYPTVSYPYYCECGNDYDDLVLEYNITGDLRYRNPSSYRICSDNSYVNFVISAISRGRLSGNGLCSNKVRICVGSRLLYFLFGSENVLRSIYLWYQY